MITVPILSMLPTAPETALAATVRPPEGQSGHVASQLAPKFPANLKPADRPVANDTFAKLDQNQTDTPFLEMFQTAGLNAPSVKLPLLEPANQAGTFKSDPTDKAYLEFGRGTPLLELPGVEPPSIRPEIAKTDAPVVSSTLATVEKMFAATPNNGRAPVQPPTALSLLQTAPDLRQATDTSDKLQPTTNGTATNSPAVDVAAKPLTKISEIPIDPAPAGRISDAVPMAAIPVSPATIAVTPGPENLGPIGLAGRDPVGQNKGVELAHPKTLKVAPRVSTTILPPAALPQGQVSTAIEVGSPTIENTPPAARWDSQNVASNTAETENLAVIQPKAAPAAREIPAIQNENAPRVDARTPTLPILDANISPDDNAQNPIPKPDLGLNDGVLGQTLPPKLQPAVPGVFARQDQPPMAFLDVAPLKLQPLRRTPGDQTDQAQSPDTAETIRTPASPTPNSQAIQPLIPEPLASLVGDRPQADLPVHALAKAGVSPTLNAPNLAPVTAKNVAIQIAQATFSNGSQAIEIALNPVELGKVRLMLHSTETGMNVQILADRPETIDLMRRHAHILEAEFENLGYQNIGFDFSNNRQGDTSENSEDQSRALGDQDVQIDKAPAIQPSYTRGSQNGGGLDLRL